MTKTISGDQETKPEIFGFAFQDIKESLLTALRAFTMDGKYYLALGRQNIPISGVHENYLQWLNEGILFQKLREFGYFGDRVLARLLDTIFYYVDIRDERDISACIDSLVVGPCVANFIELIPLSGKKSQKHLHEACFKIALKAVNLHLILKHQILQSVSVNGLDAIQDVMRIMDKCDLGKGNQPWHKVRFEAIQRLQPFTEKVGQVTSDFPKLPEKPEYYDHYRYALELAKRISPEKFREVREKLFDCAFEAFQRLGQKWKIKIEKPKMVRVKVGRKSIKI